MVPLVDDLVEDIVQSYGLGPCHFAGNHAASAEELVESPEQIRFHAFLVNVGHNRKYH